jgi:hypothetical protein
MVDFSFYDPVVLYHFEEHVGSENDLDCVKLIGVVFGHAEHLVEDVCKGLGFENL